LIAYDGLQVYRTVIAKHAEVGPGVGTGGPGVGAGGAGVGVGGAGVGAGGAGVGAGGAGGGVGPGSGLEQEAPDRASASFVV
jgi:hypothetical protein